MKKRRMVILIISVIVITLIVIWWFATRINTNFATKALLEFHYQAVPGGFNPSASISVVITDESHIAALKEILRGRSFMASQGRFICNFVTDISVTMTNGRRSIMFCPALDGCPILRIGDSNRYIRITDEDRARLDEILAIYGAFFPAV